MNSSKQLISLAIEGSATIRTFHKELTFMERFQDLADKSTAAQMNFIVAQRWLGVRIELLGAAIVFCTSLFSSDDYGCAIFCGQLSFALARGYLVASSTTFLLLEYQTYT
jgi:hypothetical protein